MNAENNTKKSITPPKFRCHGFRNVGAKTKHCPMGLVCKLSRFYHFFENIPIIKEEFSGADKKSFKCPNFIDGKELWSLTPEEIRARLSSEQKEEVKTETSSIEEKKEVKKIVFKTRK